MPHHPDPYEAHRKAQKYITSYLAKRQLYITFDSYDTNVVVIADQSGRELDLYA